MSGTLAVLLLLWIPSTLVAMLFLWPGFREDVLEAQVRQPLHQAVFTAVATTVFFVLCAIVGPVVVWRALTAPRPEE